MLKAEKNAYDKNTLEELRSWGAPLTIHTEIWIHINYLSHKHLEDEDTHPPPIHCSGVVVICQDLRSQKLRSPTERRGPISMTHPCPERVTKESSQINTQRLSVNLLEWMNKLQK